MQYESLDTRVLSRTTLYRYVFFSLPKKHSLRKLTVLYVRENAKIDLNIDRELTFTPKRNLLHSGATTP